MNKLGLMIPIFLITITLYSQSGGLKSDLTFKAVGFTDNSGQAILQLFRKEDKLPSKPFKKVTVEIINKKATITFGNLPFGDYAAILVHDKNSNNYVDHSFGLPSEPLGFSNNWKLSLFSGMPSFDKLKFTFSEEKCIYTIDIKK